MKGFTHTVTTNISLSSAAGLKISYRVVSCAVKVRRHALQVTTLLAASFQLGHSLFASFESNCTRFVRLVCFIVYSKPLN